MMKNVTMSEISSTRAQLWIAGLGLVLAGCGNGSGPGADDLDSQTSIDTASASDTGTGGASTTTVADDTGTTDASGTQGSETADSGSTGGSMTTGDTGSDDDDSTSSTGNEVTVTVGDTDGPIPCDVAEATLQPVPPNVMLVLDKSGSMVSNSWDHDDDPNTPVVTRWHSLYDVVDFVVTTFDTQINFGANLFPSTLATATLDDNACIVSNMPEIPVAPVNGANILGGIPGPNETNINGGTPATAGFVVARDHLEALNPDNPRAVVFIFDGAANCMDGTTWPQQFNLYDSNLPATVGAAWTDLDLPTYVVGIDIEDAVSPNVQNGSPSNINPYDELNIVAEAGGRPRPGPEKFYQTTNEIELQAALQEIIDDTLSCTVPLNPEPAFPDLLEVLIEDMQVPQVADCENEDGWVYTNPAGPWDSIELCGSWCAQLKATGSVKAEYYCSPG